MKKRFKTIAVVQARMGSTRLPGKVLLPLAGEPVLWWMAKRINFAESIDQVVVSTTRTLLNMPIIEFCLENHIHFYNYMGDENDVLNRVLATAKKYDADIIVDITADCPCVDPRHIDYLVEKLKTELMGYEALDYVSNDIITRSWPDGLDIQCYWTRTLQKCKKLFNPTQHCGWNIAQHPETFNIFHWRAPQPMNLPELGITLDTPEDYDLLKIIFNQFGHNPMFTAEGVVSFIIKNPELFKINSSIKRKNPEEG
jgi:spore coat polysaccharide biosynthesis protein SpsF